MPKAATKATARAAAAPGTAPRPTHRFPSWAPELTVNCATVTAPHADMDVFYSSDAVPARLHVQLRTQLDALAARGGTHPMPQYHNLIDPNLNAVDGLWVPTEFEVSERALVQSDVVVSLELACQTATGHRLPFGFGPLLAKLAAEGAPVVADCALRTPIPDLDPHKHHKLNVATQRLMGCALPLLARLRRPALLLPGPLQAVVKAQRIVLEEGAEYAGVWHEDGMNEHVVAVVVYYYRASPTLRGGALEFCSKQRQALWSGDAGGRTPTRPTRRRSPRRCRAARCRCARARSCASPTTPPSTACYAWRRRPAAAARATFSPSSSSTSATHCPLRAPCRRARSASRRAASC